MGLKYCSECGKIYLENPIGICLDCQEAEESLAERVTEFLREKGKATLDEVHEATGVKHKVILRLIRTGRISTEHDFEVFFNCESCGKPIPEGRYCDSCSNKLSTALQEKAREMIKEAQPKPQESPASRQGGRMYTHNVKE